MGTPSTGGGQSDLVSFRRLIAATTVATFVLIVIGGVVRVSDSGLGCGGTASEPDRGPAQGAALPG